MVLNNLNDSDPPVAEFVERLQESLTVCASAASDVVEIAVARSLARFVGVLKRAIETAPARRAEYRQELARSVGRSQRRSQLHWQSRLDELEAVVFKGGYDQFDEIAHTAGALLHLLWEEHTELLSVPVTDSNGPPGSNVKLTVAQLAAIAPSAASQLQLLERNAIPLDVWTISWGLSPETELGKEIRRASPLAIDWTWLAQRASDGALPENERAFRRDTYADPQRATAMENARSLLSSVVASYKRSIKPGPSLESAGGPGTASLAAEAIAGLRTAEVRGADICADADLELAFERRDDGKHPVIVPTGTFKHLSQLLSYEGQELLKCCTELGRDAGRLILRAVRIIEPVLFETVVVALGGVCRRRRTPEASTVAGGSGSVETDSDTDSEAESSGSPASAGLVAVFDDEDEDDGGAESDSSPDGTTASSELASERERRAALAAEAMDKLRLDSPGLARLVNVALLSRRGASGGPFAALGGTTVLTSAKLSAVGVAPVTDAEAKAARKRFTTYKDVWARSRHLGLILSLRGLLVRVLPKDVEQLEELLVRIGSRYASDVVSCVTN